MVYLKGSNCLLIFKIENGLPYGCPGLDKFNKAVWTERGGLSDAKIRAYNHNCPLQTLKDQDDKTTSEIIRDYANDQSHWLENFIPAFEKMMRNGYKPNDLSAAPKSWVGHKCYQSSKHGISCG